MSDTKSRIVGNNSKVENAATANRNLGITSGAIFWIRAAIATVLLLLAIGLPFANLSFAGVIITGIAFIVLGSKLKNLPKKYSDHIWFFPVVLKTVGIMVITLTLLTTGPGKFFLGELNFIEETYSCWADPECLTDKEKTELKAQRKPKPVQRRVVTVPEPKVITAKCDRRFESYRNCVKVTFPQGKGTFTYRSEYGYCPAYNRGSSMNIKAIQDGSVREYTSRYGRDLTVYIYSIKEGDAVRGARCK